MSPEVCKVHEQEVGLIHEVANDVRWIRRIGTWFFGITGGAIVLLVPLMVAFLVYVAKIDRRLSLVEHKVFPAATNTP